MKSDHPSEEQATVAEKKAHYKKISQHRVEQREFHTAIRNSKAIHDLMKAVGAGWCTQFINKQASEVQVGTSYKGNRYVKGRLHCDLLPRAIIVTGGRTLLLATVLLLVLPNYTMANWYEDCRHIFPNCQRAKAGEEIVWSKELIELAQDQLVFVEKAEMTWDKVCMIEFLTRNINYAQRFLSKDGLK